jgi:hypothetical protein
MTGSAKQSISQLNAHGLRPPGSLSFGGQVVASLLAMTEQELRRILPIERVGEQLARIILPLRREEIVDLRI